MNNNNINDHVDILSLQSSNESETEDSQHVLPELCDKTATKAYQTKAENINVVQKTDDDKNLTSSYDSGDRIENVLSGESLYKTFTFEQTTDEDIEKCIAFWKSVMQKNLEPIKCSIIESSKRTAQTEPAKEESLIISEKYEKEIQDAETKVHDYYKNMWTTALTELQKKKLDKLKLIGKSRCKMCDSQLTGTYDTDIGIDKEEIVELNTWEPKERRKWENATKKGSAKESAKIQKTEAEEPTKKSKSQRQKTESCICEPPNETLQSTGSVETIVSDGMHIRPDTTRYHLIDLINKKKKAGIYSGWRKNTVQPCSCGVDVCDCNVNPAIVSMEQADPTCGCGQLECRCKIISKEQKEDEVTEVKELIELDKEESDPELAEGIQPCVCEKECTCTSLHIRDSQEIVSPHVTIVLEAQSNASKETIDPELNELPIQEDTGPVQRDTKADVTKTHENDSQTTLNDKCSCEECDCQDE